MAHEIPQKCTGLSVQAGPVIDRDADVLNLDDLHRTGGDPGVRSRSADDARNLGFATGLSGSRDRAPSRQLVRAPGLDRVLAPTCHLAVVGACLGRSVELRRRRETGQLQGLQPVDHDRLLGTRAAPGAGTTTGRCAGAGRQRYHDQADDESIPDLRSQYL